MGGLDPLYGSRRQTTVREFLAAIKHGLFDKDLEVIEAEIAGRRATIKADLDAKIKEVYGPDAEITLPEPEPKQPTSAQCGAELGGVPTCGPASDCPHQHAHGRVGW